MINNLKWVDADNSTIMALKKADFDEATHRTCTSEIITVSQGKLNYSLKTETISLSKQNYSLILFPLFWIINKMVLIAYKRGK